MSTSIIVINKPRMESFSGEACGGANLGSLTAYTEKLIRNTEKSLVLVSFVLHHEFFIWDLIRNYLSSKLFYVTIDILYHKEATSSVSVREIIKKLEIFPNLNIFKLKKGHNFSLHSKLLISDWEKALIGSANLTNRAFFENYEVGVYIEDYNQVSSLKCYIDNIKKHSELLRT